MLRHFDWQGTHRFELENDSIRLTLLSFGARMNELRFCGKDLILGYDDMDDIRKSTIYANPTIGRFANRIADGRFALNGIPYQLEKNYLGVAHLHGGTKGFDQVEWDWTILGDDSVCFSRISPHMEMGYPGNLSVEVTYTLTDEVVKIAYNATTDQDTIVNLTNHSYFNMDGYDGEDCRKMELYIPAPYYLAVDQNLIPVGDPADVTGTRFDFRKRRPIESDYDHCFVLYDVSNYKRAFAPVCELYSPHSGLTLTVSSDLPGLQLYTGDGTSDTSGKMGIPIHQHHAVVLETQLLPDSPNHPSYPSTVLKPGEVFESVTTYAFRKN